MLQHIKYCLVCALLTPLLVFAAITDHTARVIGGVQVNVVNVSSSTIHIDFTTAPESIENWVQDGELPIITRWIAVPDYGTLHLHEVELQTDRISAMTISRDSKLSSQISYDAIEVGQACTMQDVRFIPISFHPVIQDVNDINAQIIRHISVEIDLPAEPAPLHRLSRSARQAMSDLLLNNRSPERDQPVELAGCVYVIPADNRVSELLEDLYEWRRLQGFNVHEIVVQDPNDDVRLYNAIANLNQRRTTVEYICLVGDVGGEFTVPTTLQGTSDYHYSLLSGDDLLPEAAVGRISYNSIGELSRIIQKIIEYETNPDLENIEWLRHGAVCAGNRISGLSTILVGRWVRDQLLNYGFTSVDTLWYYMNNGVEDFMRRSFDRGMSFINYRGWTGLEDWTVHEAGRLVNRYLPVALLLGCNTGDFAGVGAGFTEALLRAEGGAIGAIGSSTQQSRVNYNNALMAGYYRGVLDDDVCRLGWTLNRAKLELFATYGIAGREWVTSHAYWTNLMGDPATIIWRGEPRQVNLEAPNQVVIGEEPFEVQVSFDGEPVSGARVGLYKEEEFSVAAYTDDDGTARISYPFNRMGAGSGQLTVTGDRIFPVSREIQFIAAPHLVDYQFSFIIDDQFEPHDGNGDGIVQPFETFELIVGVTNIGNQPVQSPIRFALDTDNNAIDILEPEVNHMQNMFPNNLVNIGFLIEAQGSYPDRETIPLILTARAGEEEWNMHFSLAEGQAPRWEILSIEPDFIVRPGGNIAFDIVLTNSGSLDAGETAGILIPLNDWVEIEEEFGEYGEMFVGDTADTGEAYWILIDFDVPWGEVLPFELRIESGDNYSAVLQFALQVQQRGDGQPSGPDEYGYWAIDDLDIA